MNKKIMIAAIALAVICAAGIVLWLAMTGAETEAPAAEIRSQGQLLRTVSLSQDEEFTVTTEDGCNKIRIRDGKISVVEADCPDRVCVRTGEISGGAVPIICLPHRLEIRIVSADDDIDAQIG